MTRRKPVAMKWRCDRSRRLHVSHSALDLGRLRELIEGRLIRRKLTAIIYTTPGVTLIIAGPHLHRWLSDRDRLPPFAETAPAVARPV